LASAQWFFTRIIPQIFLYVSEQTKQGNRRIKKFIITGHSLGAGTAAVLTMMVVDHIDQLRELSNNPDFKVHCYSYAPVASVSLNLSEKYQDHIDSFVCHDDLVARLSYGTASCAKELIMDSLIAVDGFGGTSKVNSNPNIKKECFDIIQTRRKEIYHGKEPRYPLLYVPGRVYQFRRGGSKIASKLPTQDIKLPGTNPAEPQEPQGSPRKPRPRASSLLAAVDSSRRRGTTPAPPAFLPSQSEPVLPPPSNKPEEVTFTLHRSSAMLSEEVLISKTCLEDHMVVTYLTAFQTVRQDCMRQDSYRKRAAAQAAQARQNTGSTSSLSSSSTLKQSTSVSPSSTTKIKLLNNTETTIPFIQIDHVEEDGATA
jgi:hypothetical protein